MKTTISILRSLVALLSLVAFAQSARASDDCPASYPHPRRASLMKASLVQAFVCCSCASYGGNPPNTTTASGIPSCEPAETFNQNAGSPAEGWYWGPHAQGFIGLKAGKNTLIGPAYPLNVDPEAVDLGIEVKLSDVHEGGVGGLLVDHKIGNVQMLLRMTIIDRAHDQVMTVVDYPIGFSVTAIGGKIKHKTSLTRILNGVTQPALPRCATIELLSVIVKDPNGSTFASVGTYLP